MKILLCVTSLSDIKPAFEKYTAELKVHENLKFITTTSILQHEVTIVETGYGIFQTGYKITKALLQQKYHLALKVGLGNSYKPDISIGTVLNIVNEKPGDYGMTFNNEWKDLYDSGLMTQQDEPQQRGGFVNLNNAYMNVFMPFKKAVGITVNHLADKVSFELHRDKYHADCETGDGLGFVYPCMFEKQSYYQLCVIERNLTSGEENAELAIGRLNEVLTDLLQKL